MTRLPAVTDQLFLQRSRQAVTELQDFQERKFFAKRHVIPQHVGSFLFNSNCNPSLATGLLGLDAASASFSACLEVPLGAVVHAVRVVGVNPGASVRSVDLSVEQCDNNNDKRVVLGAVHTPATTASLSWEYTWDLGGVVQTVDRWLYLTGNGAAGAGTNVYIRGAYWTVSYPESYW